MFPSRYGDVMATPTLTLVPNCGSALMNESGSLPGVAGIDVRSQLAAADPGGGLNSQSEFGAGLSPLSGDLPQVPGVRVEQLGKPLPTGHVGDVGGKVHTPPTLAICYPNCNSVLRADLFLGLKRTRVTKSSVLLLHDR